MLTFGIALIVGLWFVGKEAIKTVGTSLAEMHPASGFTAELSAASVVMGASLMGLPVSSTHILSARYWHRSGSTAMPTGN